jgi:CheY-like chemotaxis protein
MKKRLLWIDDDHARLPELITMLSERGFEVHCAESVYEAKERFRRHVYDCVLLDMILPYGSTGEARAAERERSYLGLGVIDWIVNNSTPDERPRIVILSIVDEERLSLRLQNLKKRGIVSEVLQKGAMISLEDVVNAVICSLQKK